jgi:hypothetical protein
MMTEMLTYRPPTSSEIGTTSAGRTGKTLDESSGRYSQGICKTTITQSVKTDIDDDEDEDDGKNDQDRITYFGHGGLTLGFSSKMIWLDDQDLIIACATNVGSMHSGFEDDQAPWDAFFGTVLLPAAIKFGKSWR